MGKILEVKDLVVSFNTYSGVVQSVRGLDFYLKSGETLALVGESGSGKSVTSKSIMRLIPSPPGRIEKGEILFQNKDLTKLTEKQMQSIRGSNISMIFQDPMTSLNPTMTVGKQIIEGLMKHQKLNKSAAYKQALELLDLVGIPKPELRIKSYPHQFSGGMRQRVVIAIALSCNPKILIADEPTTALDVTIQAQILDLLKTIQTKSKTAIILITHDLGVVANIAHRVAVMYAGKIVETGVVDELFFHPRHPYTWGLLSSMPNLETNQGKLKAVPGNPPDSISPTSGCPFAARCPYRLEVCLHHMPPYFQSSETQATACWLLDDRAPKVKPPEELIGGLNT